MIKTKIAVVLALFIIFTLAQQQNKHYAVQAKLQQNSIKSNTIQHSVNPTIQTVVDAYSEKKDPATPTPTAVPSPTPLPKVDDSRTPVQIGEDLAAGYGWTGYEWNDLYALWERESGWDPGALNRSSGACGIPQSLPCSKILDHSTKGQIEWGLGYIKGRYGDPANALYHENLYSWY